MALMVDVVITDVPDDASARELRAQLMAYNDAATGYEDGRSLCCFIRGEDGQLVAGLDGFTWGGYAMIEWLWVEQALRRRGLGRRLVAAAEREAASRGCAVMRVNTHSFQAPDFYPQLGYQEFGRSDDTPAGHSELFLTKRL